MNPELLPAVILDVVPRKKLKGFKSPKKLIVYLTALAICGVVS